MSKIKVPIKEKKHIYIHNGLANAAFHFKKRLRLSKPQRKLRRATL